MSKYVFLGGYDAEMVEIRNILEAQGLTYHDKKLSWGACLSAYKDEIASLPADVTPVFIELTPDIPTPTNAKIIDHHDEKAGRDKKTSIEQVADLLGVELSRRQKLISANDRGHIRAMRELCATGEEIAEIRALDRKAQGVTEDDEKLAEKSIEEHLENVTDDAVIVNSLTNKTSPVFDRLYDKYAHIFVFTTDGEMNYSGTGAVVNSLVEIYRKRQKENPSFEFWYGGNLPDYGFFGAKSQISGDEIKEILNNIISQHIFVFPFRITPINEERGKGEPELNMCEIFKSFIDGGWEYKPYKVDTPAHYNEYYYFHEYVRKAIFESRPPKKIKELFLENKNTDVISYYFERPVSNDSAMTIHIKKEYFNKSYKLIIHHLSLRLFSTDIGILTIELYNYDDKLDLQDIMYINEYGRRIYPQFLPDDCDINIVKNSFLADKIVFKLGEIDSVEDFCPPKKYLEGELEGEPKKKLVVADYITKLLGVSFTERYNFIPIIDDRMFIVCWYVNAELIGELRKKECFTSKYKYETSDKWYSFVFIDNSVSNVSAGGRMKEDLIKQFTYPRWIHKGTLFGITRYSLMCLTNSTFKVLRDHMERMYYQMAIILLAQRASILKFSDDVSKISGKIESMKGKNEQKEFKVIAEKVRNLHSSFIHFVNRLWFTEVTPQEQGIEMYNIAVTNMGLKEQLDEVRHEIKELYEFVEMQYDKEMNKSFALLDKIAFIFLPIIVVASLLGMNIFSPDEIPYGLIGRIGLPILLWVLVYVVTIIFKRILTKKRY